MEGGYAFPGRLRSSVDLPKGVEFSTLFLFVAGNTCHNVASVDCHPFRSYLIQFVSLFRGGSVLQVDFRDVLIP